MDTARILKDGSDSVGALGALNRVYLNIGLFSEEWLLHFRALIGGEPITPIEIAVANKNSAYWEATEAQTPDMALFFLKSTAPHLLKDAPGGDAYLTKDKAKLERGKIVFAERCARCHSSKIPEGAPGMDAGKGCSGKDYLNCWNQYWAWTKTDDFKTKMRAIVQKPDFLDGNYLSTDMRVPVTLLQTNACSPLATNAIGDNIWDNFSSHTYKELPSVGSDNLVSPRHGAAANLRDAGRRPRLHPARIADQRLVDGSVPAEQQRREIQCQPVGRRPYGFVQRFHRADAVAGEAREGFGAGRQGSGHDRPHHRRPAICVFPPDTCRTC